MSSDVCIFSPFLDVAYILFTMYEIWASRYTKRITFYFVGITMILLLPNTPFILHDT